MLTLTQLLLLLKQSEELLKEAIKQGNIQDMNRFTIWRSILKDETIDMLLKEREQTVAYKKAA